MIFDCVFLNLCPLRCLVRIKPVNLKVPAKPDMVSFSVSIVLRLGFQISKNDIGLHLAAVCLYSLTCTVAKR